MDSLVSHIRARQDAGGPKAPLTPENEITDQSSEVLAVVGFLYGIALAAVLLRIWVRTRVLKAFGMLLPLGSCGRAQDCTDGHLRPR